MAYATNGLRRAFDGTITFWVLDTVDSVATAVGAGYVTDGASASNTGAPGKGMNLGDPVLIRVVGAIPAGGDPPAANTDQAFAYVSARNLATGACSLTLMHTNA